MNWKVKILFPTLNTDYVLNIHFNIISHLHLCTESNGVVVRAYRTYCVITMV